MADQKVAKDGSDLNTPTAGAVLRLDEDTALHVPGSFDPITLGHLDVIGRAAGLYDELHVVVVHNPDKSALLHIAQRVALIEQSIVDAGIEGRIVVASWSRMAPVAEWRRVANG